MEELKKFQVEKKGPKIKDTNAPEEEIASAKAKKRKFKAQKSQNGGENNPPCQLCSMFGGNSESHSTNQCNKKRKIEGMWKKQKQVRSQNRHELNALVAKTVRKSLKAKLKKNNLSYSSSDSSNDES